jgi:hypothetical protein
MEERGRVMVPGAHRTRRLAVAAGLVLAALTALAVWVSGRWLERPDPPPGRNDTSEKAPTTAPTRKPR